MTHRERFESIISASPYEKSVARWPNLPVKFSWPGGYKDLNVDLAWCMWQASRKQALEEALAGIDKEWVSQPSTYDFQRAARDGLKDAAAIVWRLANPEGEQG